MGEYVKISTVTPIDANVLTGLMECIVRDVQIAQVMQIVSDLITPSNALASIMCVRIMGLVSSFKTGRLANAPKGSPENDARLLCSVREISVMDTEPATARGKFSNVNAAANTRA